MKILFQKFLNLVSLRNIH